MMLLFPKWDLRITLKENVVSVLVLENPKDMSEIVMTLVSAFKSDTGEIILSDGLTPLSLSQSAELLLNPLLIEVNTKK